MEKYGSLYVFIKPYKTIFTHAWFPIPNPWKDWTPNRKKDTGDSSQVVPGEIDTQESEKTKVPLSAATVPGFEDPILTPPAESPDPIADENLMAEVEAEMDKFVGKTDSQSAFTRSRAQED